MPVLVGVDERDRYHVRLATAPSREHSGPSLAEVLDDLALEVMERAPSLPPTALARLVACPDLYLRRVRVTASLPQPTGKPLAWTGRLSVALERWPMDVAVGTVPRLGAVRFPLAAPSQLEAAVAELLAHLAPRHVGTSWVDAAVARNDEHLELLEIDADVPTVLSSRRPTPKRDPARAGAPADRTWVAPVTLRQVAVSLGHRALDGSLAPAFGRDALVEQVLRELERPGAAVLLVGPPGVGKTAIVHEVVRRRVDPHASLTERVDAWELDGNRLIAGMSVVGAWEKRVELLVSELHARGDLLVVDDLPTLVWTGRSAHSDANVAQFLVPHLARGELRIVGECTAERLAAAREEAPGFFERFRVIHVPPLDERQTLLVALRIARTLELDRPIRVTPEALTTVLAFNRRFQAHRCQPGAAVALLRLVADHVAPPSPDRDRAPPDQAGPRRAALDRTATLEALAAVSGLPGYVLEARHGKPAAEITRWFAQQVLAQPNAAEAVVDVVCTLQQGLNDPQRPIATLLFAGPTGVGKTETAKALAAWLFGDPGRLVRFDMSEFGGPESAARLVGGAREPEGELTRAVHQQPFSVILFDEIEKAHPSLFDVLLQVLGEGRLTNAVGRTADLTSTVIVMTSNLGVADANRSVGFGTPAAAAQDAHYAAAVARFFRPEFVNRIDRVVPFRALELRDVGALVERLVGQLLGRRGLRRAGVPVDVDPGVVDHIVNLGFSPVYGARALKRTLESELTVLLARELVARPPDGRVAIEVYPRGGRLEVAVEPLPVGPPGPDDGRVEGDRAAVRAVHAAVSARLAEVAASPQLAAVAARRAGLLARADALDPEEAGRLEDLLQLTEQVTDLARQLDELDEAFEPQFDDDVEIERYDERSDRERTWRAPREKLVTVHRPVGASAPALARARDELPRLQLFVAAARYRVRFALSPPDPVLLRVLPGTPESGALAARTAVALRSALYLWGRADLWWRSDGRWTADQGTTPERVDVGWAVWAQVPGLAQLVHALVGYASEAFVRGPDAGLWLARIDLLPPGDPAEVLPAEDHAWEAWRAARRRGEPVGPSPRPRGRVTLPQVDAGAVQRLLLAALPEEP